MKNAAMTPDSPAPFPAPPRSLKELSPAVARHCLRLERNLLAHGLCPGHGLLLAVSGGADSTALAVLLSLLAARQGWRLHACVIHHGLRPEADAECAHVQGLCAALGMACHVRHAPVRALARKAKTGLEESARAARYALLEEVRQATNCQWILTGHQREDLCEDQLMRLVRGTGWPALGGMVDCDPQRRLLRPLLHVSGRTLRQWLTQWRIPWCEDSSNADAAFLRNRLRHDLLPRLETENPAYGECASRLWQLAQADAAYWEQTLDAALAGSPWQMGGGAITLPRDLLRQQPAAVRLRLYLRALRLLNRRHGGQARADRLLALDAAWQAGRGNTRFQFPGGLMATLRAGAVTFAHAADDEGASPPAEDSGLPSRRG